MVTNVSVGTNEFGNRVWYINPPQLDDQDDQPSLILIQGLTYRFTQEGETNIENPFRFTLDPLAMNVIEYTDGVTVVGTPGKAGSYVEITPSENVPARFYYYNPNVNALSAPAGDEMYNKIDIIYKQF